MEPVPLRVFLNFKNQKSVFDIRYSFYTILIQISTFDIRRLCIKCFGNNECRLTNDEYRSLRRIRSERVSGLKRGSPLSAKSFYSTLFHKKDTAAIGAIFPAAVGFYKRFVQALQTPFSRILVANEDDGNETNVNQHSTFGVRHSIFKNRSLANNEFRLTNDESRSFSNGTCSIVHTSFTQFFFNGTGSIGVQALQTPFSRILVANEDDANETNANQHSTFGVRHSIFKNRLLANNEFRLTNDEYRSFAFVGRSVNQKSKIGVRYSIFKQDLLVNNEFRLTNDEYRSFAFVKTSVNQKSKIGVRYSIFKQDLLVNNEYRLTNDESRSFSNGTCSIVHSTTKQRSYQHSPDCSGYNVELAEHYLSGKRERTFIETILYRFKKLNNYKQFRN